MKGRIGMTHGLRKARTVTKVKRRGIWYVNSAQYKKKAVLDL